MVAILSKGRWVNGVEWMSNHIPMKTVDMVTCTLLNLSYRQVSNIRRTLIGN